MTRSAARRPNIATSMMRRNRPASDEMGAAARVLHRAAASGFVAAATAGRAGIRRTVCSGGGHDARLPGSERPARHAPLLVALGGLDLSVVELSALHLAAPSAVCSHGHLAARVRAASFDFLCRKL